MAVDDMATENMAVEEFQVSATDTTTLTPQHIVEQFSRLYRSVHKHEAYVRYLGNGWYHVNGEVVHRVTLFLEMGRLHEIEQSQRKAAKTSIVNRLIAKLRNL